MESAKEFLHEKRYKIHTLCLELGGETLSPSNEQALVHVQPQDQRVLCHPLYFQAPAVSITAANEAHHSTAGASGNCHTHNSLLSVFALLLGGRRSVESGGPFGKNGKWGEMGYP